MLKAYSGVPVAYLCGISILSGCAAPDPVVAPTSVAQTQETAADSIWWFRVSDYVKPSSLRFAVALHGAGGTDTVVDLHTHLDSARDSMAEWSTVKGKRTFVGCQILTRDGGVLRQQGFQDTDAYLWRSAAPLYQVPPKMEVYAAWFAGYAHSGHELCDSTALEICSQGGHCAQGMMHAVSNAALQSWNGHDSCTTIWTHFTFAFPYDSLYTGDFHFSATYCPRLGLVEESDDNGVRTRIF